MAESVSLSLAHWLYLLGMVTIIVTMIMRTTVVVPAIVATFLVAWTHTGSIVTGFTSIFNASITAAGELFNIFLIIAMMTALLGSLRHLGSDIKMIKPFQAVMTNGTFAFVILALVTYLISLFFWPTPAVPLVGAILIPAAIAAGLPAMGAAMAIAIAGQGMALSSDYIIQVAPGISAGAAGVDVSIVTDRGLVLSIITGFTALAIAYILIRKDIQRPDEARIKVWEDGESLEDPSVLAEKKEQIRHEGSFPGISDLSKASSEIESRDPQGSTESRAKWSGLFAMIVPIAFLLMVAYMVVAKYSSALPTLQGGDGAALVGGVGAIILLGATLAGSGRKVLTVASDHLTDGLVFAFKAMGAVLPIAGFFFLGNNETSGGILGIAGDAPSFLFDLVQSAQWAIPENSLFMAIGILPVGMITGADGSGFSGLPLTGALSGALGQTVAIDPSTLAAVGQMGAIWTGGGTLVAWSSMIAVAGFARVNVLDAVRMLFIPVVSGLLLSTILATVIW